MLRLRIPAKSERRGCKQSPKIISVTREHVDYRPLKILLKRDGFAVNHKRVYQLYVEEKLGLRPKRGRPRRLTTARVPLKLPVRPDEVWTMDFTQDAFAIGRKFRTLNLMGGRATRRASRSTPRWRVSDVVRVLEELKRRGRKPEAIVSTTGASLQVRWWINGLTRTGCCCTSSHPAAPWRTAMGTPSLIQSAILDGPPLCKQTPECQYFIQSVGSRAWNSLTVMVRSKTKPRQPRQSCKMAGCFAVYAAG